MAVYAGPARRRRSMILIAIAALAAGLIIGVAIGRASATSIDDEISAGRDSARELVASLRVLPLEYGQALEGSSETTLIQDTVDRSAAQVDIALDDAPWLTATQRRSVTNAVQAIRTAAGAKVPAPRFQAAIDRSTTTIQSVFGLPISAG